MIQRQCHLIVHSASPRLPPHRARILKPRLLSSIIIVPQCKHHLPPLLILLCPSLSLSRSIIHSPLPLLIIELILFPPLDIAQFQPLAAQRDSFRCISLLSRKT